MLKRMKVFSLGLGLLGVAFMIPEVANAAGPCVNCHTMHNSQDGAVIGSNTDANSALINSPGGCVGCHTGTNNGGADVVPFVLDSGDPSGKTLAGGSFYWVATAGDADDAKGHNVVDISAQDATLGLTPPGWSSDFDAHGSVGQVGAWTTQLTCAGTNGCHGAHDNADQFAAISGGHHSNDATIDGTTTGTSFRFLLGILGKEADDWEYTTTVSASNHNQYFGYARTDDVIPTAGDAVKTINYLCAECHGNFHSGAGNLGALPGDDTTAAWIRHPTDFDMNELAAGTEYKSYGGGTNAYVPLAPVASDDVSTTLSNVLQGNGDAIVSCISCHRAHGSQYDDLLRWDYSTCSAGTDDAACGCFQCHTTKDAG